MPVAGPFQNLLAHGVSRDQVRQARRQMYTIPVEQFASPAVNILENEKDYQVEIAAPGMTKEDFKVRVENDNELVISLEKKEEHKEDKKRNYLRREFSYASYHQTFIIPEEVEVGHIAAAMNDGVLTITLPKKEEVTKTPVSRQIEIV